MKLENSTWFGRLCIFRPKKNEDIGVVYEPWHHFGIIDDKVIVYIWDTREIVNVLNLSSFKIGTFESAKIADDGNQLFIGRNTSKTIIPMIKELRKKYEDLPILINNETDSLSDLKKRSTKALEQFSNLKYIEVHDNGRIVFIDSELKLPNELYMFSEMVTFNPNKMKLADMTVYLGRRKYHAIIARCAILKEILEFNGIEL